MEPNARGLPAAGLDRLVGRKKMMKKYGSSRWGARAGVLALLALVILGCQGARAGRVASAVTRPAPSALSSGWLHTSGNHILKDDGTVWVGRGANIHDTRSCNACTFAAPSVAEVNRRVDELCDVWHANFLRLTLESYATAQGRTQWKSLVNDPAYLQDIVSIVRHIETKPGVYVLVSLWIDPSFDSLGGPTAATNAVWTKLASALAGDSQVMFGIVNEPQANYDGALDAKVWTAMNSAVAAIRSAEAAAGGRQHLISVQGTRSWARRLDYYVKHPITAGGGTNIVYETHVYDPSSSFQALFVGPAATLPVIIGEFGPAEGYMTEADCSALMSSAESLQIPYLAWTFHPRCPPNLLVDNSGGGCGVGMALKPSPWGTLLKNRLASGGGSTPPPPTTAYDPKLTMGPNCNDWWVEVYAEAATVVLVNPNGTKVNLPRTSWGSFATSVHVVTGTLIQLIATASDGRQATSKPFAFRQGVPTFGP